LKPLSRRNVLLALVPPMVVLGRMGGNLPPLVYRIMVATGLLLMLFEIHNLRVDQEKMRTLIKTLNPDAVGQIESD
jgi:hypothetical protein